MGDELKSSDIRELLFEYDSDEDSDISIVGNEEVPDDVLDDGSESESEEVGLIYTPEQLGNRVVGLGASTSYFPGESQVGPSSSRPTVVSPYFASVTSDFSPKSSPLPPSSGSPEPLVNTGV